MKKPTPVTTSCCTSLATPLSLAPQQQRLTSSSSNPPQKRIDKRTRYSTYASAARSLTHENPIKYKQRKQEKLSTTIDIIGPLDDQTVSPSNLQKLKESRDPTKLVLKWFVTEDTRTMKTEDFTNKLILLDTKTLQFSTSSSMNINQNIKKYSEQIHPRPISWPGLVLKDAGVQHNSYFVDTSEDIEIVLPSHLVSNQDVFVFEMIRLKESEAKRRVKITTSTQMYIHQTGNTVINTDVFAGDVLKFQKTDQGWSLETGANAWNIMTQR